MQIVFETKLQVAKSSTGEDKFWIGRALSDGNSFYTQTESWHITKSGDESKHVFSTPKEIFGKNIGKANETTPEEQAISEINSELDKKTQKGYWNFGEDAPDSLPLPMLALKFSERGHDIKFACFGQPKLDGLRALSDGKKFWSRNGKLNIPETVAHLKSEVSKGIILDGELILPKGSTFQGTIKAAKNKEPTNLEYWVYDLIDLNNPNLTFQERFKVLAELVNSGELAPGIKLVLTRWIDDEEDLTEFHTENVKEGFEGTMLRNADGIYKQKDRSKDLQKFKDMKDEEFEIIDVVEGEGKAKGCAIFVCITNDGHVFNATPAMTDEERQELFLERKLLIGKQVTVKYQEITSGTKCKSDLCTGDSNNHRVPRFPNAMAVAVRDYE